MNVLVFSSSIDNDLELKLDVLDDFKGEGEEVHSVNPWISYAPALHRVREWGVRNNVFDLMDERLLSSTEAVELIGLVLGRDRVDTLPQPTADSKNFLRGVEALLREAGPVFDARSERVLPWFDLKVFRRLVLKKHGSYCGIS